MRCLTLNIWNYNPPWDVRRGLIAGLILQLDPDVVCVQEARHDFRFYRGSGQGEQLADLTGRQCVSHVAQVYWPAPRVDEGLAILTRRAPDRVMWRALTQLGDERMDENHRICLGIELETGAGTVRIFNTHFSLSPRAREVNALETARFVRECGDGPALLVGDLNAEPGSPPLAFLTGSLSLKGETGDFADCWTQVHGDVAGHTYASDRPLRRIDYVLARGLGTAVRDAAIVGAEERDGVRASDHLGLLVDLAL